MRLRHLLSQQNAQALDRRITCDKGVPQLRLLLLDFESRLGIVCLACGEALDVSTLSSPDQLGQHVHITTGHLPQFLWCRRVCEEGPKGARGSATAQGFFPEGEHFVGVFRLLEMFDVHLMASVKSLMQELSGFVVMR